MAAKIIELINTSILTEEQKARLITFFEQYGETQGFYDLFNETLIKESTDQMEKIKQTLDTFNAEIEKIEKLHQQEDLVLAKKMEKALSGLEQTDISARQGFVDEYDKASIELEKKYKKEMDALAARLLVPGL